MTAHKLRPIQLETRDKIRQAFRDGFRRICVVAPTGFGKTVLLADIVRTHLEKVPSGRVLVLVHRSELIEQTANKLRDAGLVDVASIGAGAGERAEAVIQIASIQTLINRPALPPASLLIIDECHHYSAAQWSKVARAYEKSLSIGFTATPERQDGKPLGDIFDCLVVAAQSKQLMDMGLLVECAVYGANMATKALSSEPVEAYARWGHGRPAVVFCSNVKLARAYADQFTAAGIKATAIWGDMDSDNRRDGLAAFQRGDVQVLTNVQVLTEGWDAPRAEVCILARKVGHAGGYLQMIGRVLRPMDGKSLARLIDLHGSFYKHGLPEAERSFSLEGRAIMSGKAPVKNCPTCGAVVPISTRVCECGYEWPASECVVKERPLSRVNQVSLEAEAWANWTAVAEVRGYMRGWVARQFVAKFGHFPAKYWREASASDSAREAGADPIDEAGALFDGTECPLDAPLLAQDVAEMADRVRLSAEADSADGEARRAQWAAAEAKRKAAAVAQLATNDPARTEDKTEQR